MSRKKRAFEAETATVTTKTAAGRYQDEFQQRVGSRVEEFGKKVEGHSKTILYGIAALVVLGIVAWIFFAWSARSEAAAQAALGKAIATSQARVTDTAPAAGSTERTFKTEQERAQAAIAEFETVAEQHGGDVGRKARYLAAVTRLSVDRSAATQQLEELAKSDEPAGRMAKFALAQVKVGDGKLDEAAALYQELNSSTNTLPSKDTVSIELAKVYEKQGKRGEAVNLLFSILKSASEAKDLDGKPVPLSPNLQAAKEKLRELDPQKAAEVQEPVTDSALGAQ